MRGLPLHLDPIRKKGARSRMWLLLLVLVAGIWCTMDAVGSVVDGLREIQDKGDRWSLKDKILMTARLVRGLFGWILIVVAFFMALGS